MNAPLHILHLEDDPKDTDLVQERLEADGVSCRVTRVETEAEFRAALDADGYALILADYTLPSFDGLSALQIASEKRPQIPFIFLSGTLDEDVAIEAMKIGATDYVFKTRLSRLLPSVRRALREGEERVERLQAEAALRRSEAYLAEAQRLSHTGSFGWNGQTGEIYWTPETYRIFAIDPETKPTVELSMERTHPEDRAFARQIIDLAMRERKEYDCQYRLLTPAGEVKHIRVVAHLAPGGFEFVGAVTDISEFKQSQEALRTSQAQLAHAARVMTMGELAGSIAHEVNQPLSAILATAASCIRWLDAKVPNLVEAREAAARIVRDAKRAGDVIHRIRGLTRNAPIQKERLDLNAVIEEVVSLTRSELLKNRVALRLDLRDGLPRIVGDRVQVQQLVLNLIVNATEAMSGIADLRRELSISTHDGAHDQVLVRVRDSGVGLDPGSSERIFDAFYTTKATGMGLGLSICRSIVQSHGGRLWATPNEQGPGTTFQFTLPFSAGG